MATFFKPNVPKKINFSLKYIIAFLASGCQILLKITKYDLKRKKIEVFNGNKLFHIHIGYFFAVFLRSEILGFRQGKKLEDVTLEKG